MLRFLHYYYGGWCVSESLALLLRGGWCVSESLALLLRGAGVLVRV